METETITFNELKRLTFCNSNKLLGAVIVIDGIPHEWVGIGLVECGEPNPKWTERIIKVVERGTDGTNKP